MKRLLLYITLSLAIGITAIASHDIESIDREITFTTSVRASQGHIILSSSESRPITFHIYSIIGQLVKSVTVSSESETIIEMPRGYYIVKCEKWTKQVIVK